VPVACRWTLRRRIRTTSREALLLPAERSQRDAKDQRAWEFLSPSAGRAEVGTLGPLPLVLQPDAQPAPLEYLDQNSRPV